MAVAITATDNQDGTGIDVVVSGSNAASTNTLYYQKFSSPSTSWTAGSSQTGDGTITELLLGYHWIRVESDLASVITHSNFVFVSGTSTIKSVQYRCMYAVKAIVTTMAFSGVSTIKVQKLPWVRKNEKLNAPMVVISHPGSEKFEAATNTCDDIGYPVLIALYDIDNQQIALNSDKYLRWRERLARAFRSPTLPGVPEVIRCTVEYGPIVVPGDYVNNVYQSPLTARFYAREKWGIE